MDFYIFFLFFSDLQNTAITVFAFCLLFAISTAQFFGGFSGEEGADGFGYNAVNGDFGHFGGPIALTFGSQGLPPRMQGVRDARQNRGMRFFISLFFLNISNKNYH